MKKMLTAALCAASVMLASCATMPTPSTGQAAQIGSAINRAQAAYDRIASTAELVPPFLSPERAARVRLAMSLATGSAVCSNGSGSTRRAEAGRGGNRGDQDDSWGLTGEVPR